MNFEAIYRESCVSPHLNEWGIVAQDSIFSFDETVIFGSEWGTLDASDILDVPEDPWCLYIKKPWGVFRCARWEYYCTLEQYTAGHWQDDPLDPGFMLVPTRSAAPRHGPHAAFLDEIPSAVGHVASGFSFMQWTVLRLLRTGNAAMELAQDTPALFWLLAYKVGTGAIPLREAGALLHKSRRSIVSACCGPSPFTPKWFRKVRSITYDSHAFTRLQYVLSCPEIWDTAAHLPRVVLESIPSIPPAVLPYVQCRPIRSKLEQGIPKVYWERLAVAYAEIVRMVA